MLRRSVMTGAAVVGLVAITAAGCSSGTAKRTVTGKTLVVENNPISNMTDTFNPFSATAVGKTLDAEALFYEPLIQFNNTRAGQTYPWLAQSYTWNTAGTAITFTLRAGVTWSDGKAFTAADVAYTFQLMQHNKALNYNSLPITGESTSGTNSVTITFSSPEFTNIYAIAGQTWIVPQHIWSAQRAPATWADPRPVGTGPYSMDKFSPGGFTLKANDSYWGGVPQVSEVSFPTFASNAAALTALEHGAIDYAGNEIGNIQTSFVAKDPTHNHYYFPSTNTIALIPNVTTWPFSNKAVRLAVSAGINRGQLFGPGEIGYEPPVTSSSGLLLPNFAGSVPSTMVNDISAASNTAKVVSIMTAAGFTKDAKGYWALKGKEASFTVEDPSATEYFADATVIAGTLKPLGFNVEVDGVSTNAWNSDVAAGTFSSTIRSGAGGPTAYTQYDNWLDYGQVSASPADSDQPSGGQLGGDPGRWNDPATQRALAQFVAANGLGTQQLAINALASIVSTEAPVIPLVYGAGWFEYNTKDYIGWPTEQNSYIDPSPNSANVEYVILHLTRAISGG